MFNNLKNFTELKSDQSITHNFVTVKSFFVQKLILVCGRIFIICVCVNTVSRMSNRLHHTL